MKFKVVQSLKIGQFVWLPYNTYNVRTKKEYVTWRRNRIRRITHTLGLPSFVSFAKYGDVPFNFVLDLQDAYRDVK